MSVSLFHDNFFAMGTRFETVFWDVDRSFARSVHDEIHDEVTRLEADLSHYEEKSPISAINKNAGIKPVSISQPVLSALQLCRQHYEKTGGLFDVTVRPAALSTAESDSFLPDIGQSAPSDMSRLKLSEENDTAYLGERGMEIDLGGIGKGMALERAEQILDQHHIKHALISFGESSILTRGHHPHGNSWKLGISDISHEDTSRYTFTLNDHALSTSGNTPRNAGHIHHPQTGQPVSDYQTVSVLTSSPVEAEVLSTALLVAGTRDARRLLKTYDPEKAVRISYDRHGRFTHVTELNKSHLL